MAQASVAARAARFALDLGDRVQREAFRMVRGVLSEEPTMFVTSSNRAAVRKVLTAAGLPAVEVRGMTLTVLGRTLRELVADGRVTAEAASAACADATGSDHDDVTATTPPAKPVPSNGAAKPAADLAAAISSAIAAALAATPAGVDADAVRAIVRETVDEMRLQPAVVEIRTDGATRTIEGARHAMFETVLRIVSSRVAGRRLHVWLAGPSGSGKSFLAAQVAEAAGLSFYSTGAIQTKYELVGFTTATGETVRTPFRDAFENGGVFAWDDIDRSDAKAFAAFNEALANGKCAFPDRVVQAHPDFVAVASANTWGTGATSEYVGATRLDMATLNRFVRVTVAYDERLESDLVGNDYADWAKFVQSCRAAVERLGLKMLMTPRQTLQGAALLAAGFERREVEDMVLFAGLPADAVGRIRAAA